ncbi:hypothetical protein EV421DRAFT_1215847 [Armillaria borealis]|uniref:DUF6534 domain-containing protein n=1 Tax=Armillaria borealis TaxID=47425 RepID=A0AA39J431_9AGAR|nr:hypothetical protein EV421DRAFT_1215847 [Armillaria borealis]
MYGNFLGALEENVIWSMRVQLLVKVWTIVFVQGIYAIRLWKVLGRHFYKIVPWSVFLGVAASFGTAIHLSYEAYVMRILVSISVVTASIYTFYAIIITADFIIALMMCYYLHKSRVGIHFSLTADLLLGLMRLVLVSGAATSACSLLSIFTFIAWPKTMIFVAIDFILPKLYINSLLAMFNYRRQRSSNKPNAEHIGRSIPAVLQFSPNDYEEHSKEMDISIPLSDIQDICSVDKSGNSKGTVDSPA